MPPCLGARHLTAWGCAGRTLQLTGASAALPEGNFVLNIVCNFVLNMIWALDRAVPVTAPYIEADIGKSTMIIGIHSPGLGLPPSQDHNSFSCPLAWGQNCTCLLQIINGKAQGTSHGNLCIVVHRCGTFCVVATRHYSRLLLGKAN